MQRILKTTFVLLFCSVSCGFAQELASRPVVNVFPTYSVLSLEQQQELTKWVAAMKKWQHFEETWDNKVAHSSWGDAVLKKRLPRPDQPVWLAATCGHPQAAADDLITQACEYLQPRPDVDKTAAQIRQQTLAARADKEKLAKNTFWTRTHLDLPGTQSSFGSGPRIVSFIGAHISLVDIGRVQVFGPPGVQLFRVPNLNGGHDWKPGYTWGASVRIGDISIPFFPGTGKNATVFLSITRCWVTGVQQIAGMDVSGIDFVNLSISRKKK